MQRPVRGKQTKRCRTTSCDVARNSLSILFQKHRPVQSINQSQVSGNVEDQSQVLGNFEEGGWRGRGGRKSVNRTEPVTLGGRPGDIMGTGKIH